MNATVVMADTPGCASDARARGDAELARAGERMSKEPRKPAFGVSLLCCAALAACGGGGGGGGGVAQFSSFSNVPANGTYEMRGQAVTATHSGLSAGNVVVSAFAESGEATIRVTNQNGNTIAYDLRVPGASTSIDMRNGDRIEANFGLIGAGDPDGDYLALIANSPYHGWEHQSFGVWTTGIVSGSGVTGAASFGSRTARENMPSAGTAATYNGEGLGVATLADGKLYNTSSQVTVQTADFSTVSISSTSTLKFDLETAVWSTEAGLDYTGTGSVSGNGFVANISGTDTSGTANGKFYGPRAEEVGGTFRATGSGGVVHAGAFGGAQ